MKKVLIISYFFPPNNYTASNRAYSFAKYLKCFGFYPIIITRNWDIIIQNTEDLSKPSGTSIKHQKFNNYEVYYLPFKGSIRDQFYSKFGSKFAFIRKVLSFFELILENFGLTFISHSNFYFKAKELLKTEDNLNHLIISSSPFNQFYYGFLLKKEFKKLKWIADYRDEWTSRTLISSNLILDNFISFIQEKNEKRWLKSADRIISVSDRVTKSISKHTGNKHFSIIENGFFEEDYHIKKQKLHTNEFIITYTGEIYTKQDFSIFFSAINKIILEFKDKVIIKIQFIGIANNQSKKDYLLNLMKGVEDNLVFTKRVLRKKCVALEMQSNLLLMVVYGKLKGVPSSKLYQYIGSEKPVFICPSDKDIIEYYLSKTNQGIVANNSKEAYDKLKNIINNFIINENLNTKINKEEIKKFSRKHQAKKLAEILDSL